MEIFVHLSVRTPLSIPILTVRFSKYFLFERYDIRDLSFMLFVYLSVRTLLSTSVPTIKLKKIFFRDLSLYFLSVCPYTFSTSVLTIIFSKKQESRPFYLFRNFFLFIHFHCFKKKTKLF